MTSTEQTNFEYYPIYCFHLSPTINKWCSLGASDIKALTRRRGFEGQDDIFFHLNHPIRWVRIVGVLVAIDEYKGRRVYTVDDSTGICIECCWTAPKSKDKKDAAIMDRTINQTILASLEPQNPFPGIDVGMVIEVKGSLKLFHEQRQIEIGKLQHVRSTNQEVQFWNKIKAFRSDVLSQPWVLERKVLRKLEKENRSDLDERERAKKRKKRKQEDEDDMKEKAQRSRNRTAGASSLKNTSYRPSKLRTVMTNSEGRYDALGL